MKITPDNLARLKEAAKILSSLPFTVSVETISEKPTVQLFFGEEEFKDNFRIGEVESTDYATFFKAEQDGVYFTCCEPKEEDNHD